jgi:hypothetical protein
MRWPALRLMQRFGGRGKVTRGAAIFEQALDVAEIR